MLYPSPEDALKGLSGAALERAYRAWAKRLHPDGTDGNHEAFLRLQQAYHDAKSASNPEIVQKQPSPQAPKRAGANTGQKSVRESGSESFDPWEAIRETGRTGLLSSEDCLFAALERWRQAGSPTARPVNSPSIGARNRRILLTVLHWASSVDNAFARDFALFVRFDTGPLRTTATSRAERDARRKLEAGLDDLLRYRDEGRPVTAALALERLEAAKETVELHGLPRPEILRIADWMIQRISERQCKNGKAGKAQSSREGRDAGGEP